MAELKEPKETPKSGYTPAEVAALNKEGHSIGAPGQKLSEGHTDESIAKWEKWEVELFLRNEMRDGKEVGVPYEFYAVKLLRGGLSGSKETFQAMNKQADFRLTTRPNYHNYIFPAGSVEAGKRYPCKTFMEKTGRGVDEKHFERIHFEGMEDATGAPKA